MIPNLQNSPYLTHRPGQPGYAFTPEQWAAIAEDRARWLEAKCVCKTMQNAKTIEAYMQGKAEASRYLSRLKEPKRSDMARRLNVIRQRIRERMC